MFGSALFSSSILTISVCPLDDAVCSGIQPPCGDSSLKHTRYNRTLANTDMPAYFFIAKLMYIMT